MAKKKYRTLTSVEEVSVSLPQSLRAVINTLEALAKKFGDDAILELDYREWEYDTYLEWLVRYDRLETDAERNKRLAQAAKRRREFKERKEREEQHDRELYEELKQRFEAAS